MARVNAQEFTDKWSRRLKAATPDIQAGINRVNQAPGVKAAAQAQTMINNLTSRVQDGTWAKQVGRVTLQEWKDKALNKGVGRIAAGVDASKDKMTIQAGKLLAAVDGAVAEVNKTPRGDLSANVQRAVTFMTEMSKRAPKRQG